MNQDLTVSRPPAGELAASAPREAAASDTAATLSAILRAAGDPKTDIEKIERLMALHERLLAQQAKATFARAMRECQEEMRPVVRDAKNPHSNSRYARLETIDNAIRPVYTRHGFSLSFSEVPQAEKSDQINLRCVVRHSEGADEEYFLRGTLDTAGAKGTSNKTEIQGLGSTVSYLRRYLTCMIFNVTLVNEDNDGQGSLGGVLNKQEAQTLADLLKLATDPVAAESKFLGFMRQKSIADIPRAEFAKGYNLLMGKLRHKQETEAAQQPTDGPPANLIDLKRWPEDPRDEWYRVGGRVYRRKPDSVDYEEWKKA